MGLCLLQDGIGFAYHGHKIVIELTNGDENDLAGEASPPQEAQCCLVSAGPASISSDK